MEHLLQPSNSRIPDIAVPFLWGDKYDGQGFLRYPERMGWTARVQQTHHQYLPGEEDEGNLERQSAFMQQWLYFGLLTEVLRTYDVGIDPEQFLRFEDDGVYLTTSNLRAHLEKALENNRKFSPEELKTRWSGAMMHFEKAVKFARCTAHVDDVHSLTLTEDQALAITVLGVTLQSAVYYMSQDIAGNLEAVPAHIAEAMLGYETITSRFVRHRMLSLGWCVSDIKLLETYLDAGSAYFASKLERLGMRRDHSNCSDRACVANHTDAESYQPTHVEEGCDCAFVEADSARVTKILQGGGIPVVQLSIQADGTPALGVVTSSGQDYVAISHVWSDGLGNPAANSLPRCQLVRLHGLMSGLRKCAPANVDEAAKQLEPVSLNENSPTGIVTLWIDTLCVPLEKQANSLAMASLHKTYRGAGSVLVLDAELHQASMKSTWQELCIRIAVSGWSKRLASLEAGFATKHLLFQFKEKAVEIRRLIQDKRSESDDILRWRFNRTVYRLFSNRVPKYREKPDITDLVSAGDSLMFRKASKPEFEPLCLAMMMGLDVNKLLATESAEERMKIFYCMLPEIPLNMLFLMGPKLDIEGYRWAPKSLMDPNSNIRTRWRGKQLTGTAQYKPETNCLSLSLPGYVIKLNKGHSDVYFFVRDGEQGKIMFLVDQRHDQAAWSKVSELEEVVLVTETSGQHRSAFLASAGEDSDEVIRAHYLFPVEVSPLSDVGNAGHMDPDNFKGALGICTKKLPPSQRWCIV